MSTKNIRRMIAYLAISIAICSSVVQAAVVDVYCGDTAAEGLSEYEYVSDIVEGEGTLYYLITNGQTGYQEKIISADIADPEPVFVYSSDLSDTIAGMDFIDMELAASGELWTVMWDNAYRYSVAVFGDGKLLNTQECPTKPHIEGASAVWESNNSFYCWDGSQITAYLIPAACATVGDFTVADGRPVFVDWTNGEVLRFLDGERTEAVFTLPGGQKFSYADLEICGGELYLSYRADNEAGLVRISDGTKYSNQAFYIMQEHTQADGSSQLMMTDIGSSSIVTYVQGTIQQNEYTQRTVETYLLKAETSETEVDEAGLPVGFHYIDSAGNQWIYHLRESTERGIITKVTQDGTAIRMCSANTEKKFLVYWNNRGVSFDTEPYITDAGYMMVPVRGISSLLGADVNWDEKTRTVTISKEGKTIGLQIDSTTAAIDGEIVSLGATATIVDGRTMVPLRFLVEALGGEVSWTNNAAYIN